MLSRKDAYALMASEFAKANAERRAFGLPELPIRSGRSFDRYIKDRQDYQAPKQRFGRREADRIFKNVGRTYLAELPGEVVQIDATPVDLATIDASTGLTIQRPWLMAAVDERTRVALAVVVSTNGPSIECLSDLFLQMVQSTGMVYGEERAVNKPFRPNGLPATIKLDNPRENTGRSMQAMCAANGINLEFGPVRRPQHKGIVERFLGTVNHTAVHSLPGGIPFIPQRREKLDIKPEAEAVITHKEAEALIKRFVFCEYHYTRHSDLGRSPKAQWEADTSSSPLLRPSSMREFEYSLGFETDRSLDRRGIFLHGLQYNGAETTDLLNDLLPRAPGKSGRASVTVKVRYLPNDLSKVIIFNQVSKSYVALPCVTPGFETPISKFALDWLKKRIREDGKDPEAEARLIEERASRVREVQELARDRKLRNRTLAKRLKSVEGLQDSPQAPSESSHDAEVYLPAETLSALHGVNEPRPAKRTRRSKRQTDRQPGRSAGIPSSPQQRGHEADLAPTPSRPEATEAEDDPVKSRFWRRKAQRENPNE